MLNCDSITYANAFIIKVHAQDMMRCDQDMMRYVYCVLLKRKNLDSDTLFSKKGQTTRCAATKVRHVL